MDVTKKENLQKRIDMMETGLVDRIVALYGDKIIADGALEMSPHEWQQHTADIRIIMHKDFRRRGLGMIMARELYYLAAAKKVEKIMVKIMRKQEAVKNSFHRLGFHEEALLPDYVKDRKGRIQDLLIMSIDMKELWEEMEHEWHLSDFQRSR